MVNFKLLLKVTGYRVGETYTVSHLYIVLNHSDLVKKEWVIVHCDKIIKMVNWRIDYLC